MSATWRDACIKRPLSGDGGSFLGGPIKIVLHSTETGLGVPGYQGGATAPHETWVWDKNAKRFRLYQHTSHARAARALRNPPGGVQTNRDSAHQIEIAGSCDKSFAAKHGYLYLPEAGDDFLRELGQEIRDLANDIGCPLTVAKQWVRYPLSAGNGPSRFSLSQWDNYSGVLGHQHAAENTHGDPGDLDVARALLLSGKVEIVDKPDPVQPKKPGILTKVFGKAPKYPLARGHYFGPEAGPNHSHSGYHGAGDRAGLRVWQKQMRARGYGISVDGLYGKETERCAKAFQRKCGLAADGLIGSYTWKVAWTANV